MNINHKLGSRALVHSIAVVIWASAQLLAASFPAADPEDQGLSDVALQEIAATVRGYADRDVIVGGILLVIKNRHSVGR